MDNRAHTLAIGRAHAKDGLPQSGVISRSHGRRLAPWLTLLTERTSLLVVGVLLAFMACLPLLREMNSGLILASKIIPNIGTKADLIWMSLQLYAQAPRA